MILLKRVWQLFNGREKPWLLALLLGMLGNALLEAVGLGLVIPYVTYIGNPEVLQRYRIFHGLNWLEQAYSHRGLVVVFGLGLLAFYFLKNLCLLALGHFQNQFLFKKQMTLSTSLLQAYMRKPYAFHLSTNSSDLYSNIGAVGTTLQGVVIPLFSLAAELLVVGVIVAMLFVLMPGPAALAIASLAVPSLFFFVLVRKRMKAWGELKETHSRAMTKSVQQSLGGIKEILVARRERFFLDEFRNEATSFSEVASASLTLSQLPRLFLETVAVGVVVALACFLVTREANVAEALPRLGLFVVATGRLLPSLSRIMGHIAMIRQCTPALDYFSPDLNEMREHDGAAGNTASVLNKPVLSLQNALEFKGVGFRYATAQKQTLKNIDFSIAKGSSIGIIGPSGAGKTTLVDLALGLFEPTAGSIFADGIDIQRNIPGWQSRVGYIPQTIYLTDDTIRRNIAFGVPNEQIDENSVWTALRAAKLDDYVASLPDGLNTFVGERGVRMSGGQRQRVGIARALYRDPDLLILDEATSALDHETEQEVSRAIEGLIGRKTLIIIAHRLTTVKRCDRLYRLVDGEMTSSGTFSELCEKH